MKNPIESKFSRLVPLDVVTRTKIAVAATEFFNPVNIFKMRSALNRSAQAGPPELFRAFDFIDYLTKANIVPEAMRSHQRIQALLDRLVATGILMEYSGGNEIILGKRYCFLREQTELESRGRMWLAPALGPDFLTGAFSSVIVRLTGKTTDGDTHAGTGIILTPTLILTCAHVITDMKLDESQTLQGEQRRIVRELPHPKIDVGVIEVFEPCKPMQCLAFRDPEILDDIYVIGFPKVVPYTRDVPIITQRGEVTNSCVQAFDGNYLFLFSAITRPGNSGGPIISSEGRILGLVTQALESACSTADAEPDQPCRDVESPHEMIGQVTAPFFSGVATSQIQKAVSELDSTLSIPVENYIGTNIELRPSG